MEWEKKLRAKASEWMRGQMNVQILEFVCIYTNLNETEILQVLYKTCGIEWWYEMAVYLSICTLSVQCTMRVCMIHFTYVLLFRSLFRVLHSIRVRFKFIKYSYIRSLSLSLSLSLLLCVYYSWLYTNGVYTFRQRAKL